MATITIPGSVRLPGPRRLHDAELIVGLDDVLMLDARAIRVAETRIRSLDGMRETVSFTLRFDETKLKHSTYVLSAEIHQFAHDCLAPGDFLTTASYPWNRDRSHDVEITVAPL
ncbi:YbaY family lipoprotein [Ideonella azotifigens]|uniref:Uncharacterized protein n=1 Tax=Ideonella azotifigens TaxID=513160 RepID=A0ABP3V756_9BURK|nr:YbaY family lipoprotein [Ideonella azotifigens]MCD2342664.1 YbaY family lipoprotein [Ideonella azotifigens]